MQDRGVPRRDSIDYLQTVRIEKSDQQQPCVTKGAVGSTAETFFSYRLRAPLLANRVRKTNFSTAMRRRVRQGYVIVTLSKHDDVISRGLTFPNGYFMSKTFDNYVPSGLTRGSWAKV